MFGADLLATCIRLLCGVRPLPPAAFPEGPCVVYANHSSHLDFVVIWAALPSSIRARMRPVAGRDYWERTALHRFLAKRVFNAVLIERQKVTTSNNPLSAMVDALAGGASLIVFPEGTRSPDGTLHEFKAGLYHLARARPDIPLIPVYLQNLNRVLPKGEFLPVPLLVSLRPGASITLQPEEPKPAFLARTRGIIETLASSSQ